MLSEVLEPLWDAQGYRKLATRRVSGLLERERRGRGGLSVGLLDLNAALL